jgi:hypothetical protein
MADREQDDVAAPGEGCGAQPEHDEKAWRELSACDLNDNGDTTQNQEYKEEPEGRTGTSRIAERRRKLPEGSHQSRPTGSDLGEQQGGVPPPVQPEWGDQRSQENGAEGANQRREIRSTAAQAIDQLDEEVASDHERSNHEEAVAVRPYDLHRDKGNRFSYRTVAPALQQVVEHRDAEKGHHFGPRKKPLDRGHGGKEHEHRGRENRGPSTTRAVATPIIPITRWADAMIA